MSTGIELSQFVGPEFVDFVRMRGCESHTEYFKMFDVVHLGIKSFFDRNLSEDSPIEISDSEANPIHAISA